MSEASDYIIESSDSIQQSTPQPTTTISLPDSVVCELAREFPDVPLSYAVDAVFRAGFASVMCAKELFGANLPANMPNEPAQCPVERGIAGEAIVRAALEGDFIVENTAKKAWSADLHVFHGETKIICEVKNYTNVVPSSEVTKFMRDITTTPCDGALFVSIGSPITSLPCWKFTVVNDTAMRSIPIVFITSNVPGQILTAAHMLKYWIESTAQTSSQMTPDLEIGVECVSKGRYALSRAIAGVYKLFDNVSEQFHASEMMLRRGIDTAKAETPTAIAAHKLMSVPAVAAYSSQTQHNMHLCIAKIENIGIISSADPFAKKVAWRTTKTHLSADNGYAFKLLKGGPILQIPRVMLTSGQIADLLQTATIDPTTVSIPVDENTHNFIG